MSAHYGALAATSASRSMAVSLHTILRGTTPAFVLLFAIGFGLQPFSAPLCGSVLTVVLGGCLAAAPTGSATEGERVAIGDAGAALEHAGARGAQHGAVSAAALASDERLGLLFVLLSCVFSGLRWVRAAAQHASAHHGAHATACVCSPRRPRVRPGAHAAPSQPDERARCTALWVRATRRDAASAPPPSPNSPAAPPSARSARSARYPTARPSSLAPWCAVLARASLFCRALAPLSPTCASHRYGQSAHLRLLHLARVCCRLTTRRRIVRACGARCAGTAHARHSARSQ